MGVEEGRLGVVLSEPFVGEDGVLYGLIVIKTRGENLTAATAGDVEEVQTLLVKKDVDDQVVVLTPPDRAGVVADAPDDGPLVLAANNSQWNLGDI